MKRIVSGLCDEDRIYSSLQMSEDKMNNESNNYIFIFARTGQAPNWFCKF
ncbi:MAG: hypothetical protein ABI891_03940 [Acidobacteriota bacterium]